MQIHRNYRKIEEVLGLNSFADQVVAYNFDFFNFSHTTPAYLRHTELLHRFHAVLFGTHKQVPSLE